MQKKDLIEAFYLLFIAFEPNLKRRFHKHVDHFHGPEAI